MDRVRSQENEGISSALVSAVCICIVLVTSYFTMVQGYEKPQGLFWDENYHIASAQKYLHGVFFMESHPPLGKLLIALGELLTGANAETSQFIDTPKGSSISEDFSFVGYRLFPTLLGWLAAAFFFLCLNRITGNSLVALLLSSLYIFDNALIVHLRGAMLEGPQLFFLLLNIYSFLLLYGQTLSSTQRILRSLLFGASLGSALAIKYNAGILVLLIPFILMSLRGGGWRATWRKGCLFLGSSLTACVLVFLGIWYLHFAIATSLNPALEKDGYFGASEKFKRILDEKQTTMPQHLPLMVMDSLRYSLNYNRGVPKLNLCKHGENGSPAFLWPFGARAINYRWEDGAEGKVRYTYLQSNPACWLLGLVGLILSVCWLVGRLLFGLTTSLRNEKLIVPFVSLYLSYMIVMIHSQRVMYLYHYFIPLIITYLLFGLFGSQLFDIGRWRASRMLKGAALSLSFATIVGTFFVYSPLTYGNEVSDEYLENIALLDVWDLTCNDCRPTNGFAIANGPWREIRRRSMLSLSGLLPESMEQEWGAPKRGLSVIDRPIVVDGQDFQNGFGVHAKSRITYHLNKEYGTFRTEAGLPGYLIDTEASVVFAILQDGQETWRSATIYPDQHIGPIELDVSETDMLVLLVEDAGDGIYDDHAVWLNPELLSSTVEPDREDK